MIVIKKLFGIIAYVNAREESKKAAIHQGIYIAAIHDDLFELEVPQNFQPKAFQ